MKKCKPYREEADLLARALGCRLLRTSVKEDINVNAVFRHLAACCLAELHLQEEEYALSGGSNGLHPLTISKYSTTNKREPWSALKLTTPQQLFTTVNT